MAVWIYVKQVFVTSLDRSSIIISDSDEEPEATGSQQHEIQEMPPFSCTTYV